VTLAAEVHHTVAVADGGDEFAQSNLESICEPCHREASAEQEKARRGG
jgi:5-methylcytosine-specific restriction endonuclease McrA